MLDHDPVIANTPLRRQSEIKFSVIPLDWRRSPRGPVGFSGDNETSIALDLKAHDKPNGSSWSGCTPTTDQDINDNNTNDALERALATTSALLHLALPSPRVHASICASPRVAGADQAGRGACRHVWCALSLPALIPFFAIVTMSSGVADEAVERGRYSR